MRHRAVIDPRGTAALAVLFLAACREPPKPQRTEPWPAPLASASASGPTDAGPSRVLYGLQRGKLELEIVSGGERARGGATKLRADIDVDWLDPRKTTGRVEVDLDALEITMPDGIGVDRERTERVRQALAFAPGSTPGGTGVAVFSIRALEPLRQGSFLVRGDLALHGIRAPETVEVTVANGHNPAEGPPDRLVIRSLSPLVVSLSTHDIRPIHGRSPHAAGDTSRAARKTADEASVSFELELVRKP